MLTVVGMHRQSIFLGIIVVVAVKVVVPLAPVFPDVVGELKPSFVAVVERLIGVLVVVGERFTVGGVEILLRMCW